MVTANSVNMFAPHESLFFMFCFCILYRRCILCSIYLIVSRAGEFLTQIFGWGDGVDTFRSDVVLLVVSNAKVFFSCNRVHLMAKFSPH